MANFNTRSAKAILASLFLLFTAYNTRAASFTYIKSANKTYYFFINNASFKASVYWDFGDGSIDSVNRDPVHTYSTGGRYPVMLRTTDSAGTNFFYDTICVTAVAILATPGAGSSSNTYTFKAQIFPRNFNLTYAWHSPDSLMGTDSIISYRYAQSGGYAPTLTVMDPANSCTEFIRTYIKVDCPFDYITLTLDSNVIKSGRSIKFTLKLPTGISYSGLRYNLSVQDTVLSSDSFSSLTKVVNHTFYASNVSRYLPALATIYSNTCKSVATQSFTVQPKDSTGAPDPDSCLAYVTGNAISKDAKTWEFRVISKKSPVSYNWNFGDGGSSSSSMPTHIYSSLGYYNVSVALNYGGACPADTVYGIGDASCLTYFQISRDSNNQFSGIITDWSRANSGARYHWDFGDGDTSNSKTPIHTYAGQGPFLLCLTIYDSTNCNGYSHCDTIGFDTAGNLNMALVPFSIKVVDNTGHNQSINHTTYDNVNLKYYPNPANDILHLSVDITEPCRFIICSMDGKTLSDIRPENNKDIRIDCHEWQSGIYMMRVLLPNGSTLQRTIMKY